MKEDDDDGGGGGGGQTSDLQLGFDLCKLVKHASLLGELKLVLARHRALGQAGDDVVGQLVATGGFTLDGNSGLAGLGCGFVDDGFPRLSIGFGCAECGVVAVGDAGATAVGGLALQVVDAGCSALQVVDVAAGGTGWLTTAADEALETRGRARWAVVFVVVVRVVGRLRWRAAHS